MKVDPPEVPCLRFERFELDLSNCELKKVGRRIRLQRQPFRVLILLATRAGRVVSREEIQQELWGAHTFVDFEQGLNFCIKQIRTALGDSARSPRYVETLARQGYRLMASVDGTPSSFEFARKRFSLREGGPARKVVVEVCPFKDFGCDSKNQHLPEAIREAVLAHLATIDELVITSHGIRGRADADLGNVADLVVEGSIIQGSHRTRIIVRLLHAKNGQHLWTETYDRNTPNLIALQDEIGLAVATQIRNRFGVGDRALLENLPAVETQIAYLRGRYYWNKRTPAALEKAIEHFRSALQGNSNYAAAYAGIADCYAVLGGYDLIAPGECFPAAKQAAMKAWMLDPRLPEAHTSLGFVRFFYDWDWAGAEREFKQAIELDPGHANAHHWLSMCLAATGRITEARAEIEKARQLDPLSLIIDETVGWMSHFARQYDRAIEDYRKTLDLDSNFLPAYEGLGLAYEQKLMWKEAIEAFQKAVTLSEGTSRTLAAVGHAYAASGHTKKARKILKELEAFSTRNYVSAHDIALIHVGLGDRSEGLHWLNRAFHERAAGLVWLKVEPRLDILRDVPQFQLLQESIGLSSPDLKRTA